MKFLFDFLKKLIPPVSMFLGGSIPITLTVKALISSVPTETNTSLLVEEKTPVFNEKTIQPTVPVSTSNPSSSTKTQEKQTRQTEGGSGKTKDASPTTNPTKTEEGKSKETKENTVSTPDSLETSADIDPKPKTTPAKPTKPKSKTKEMQRLLQRVWSQFSPKKEDQTDDDSNPSSMAKKILDLLSGSSDNQAET